MRKLLLFFVCVLTSVGVSAEDYITKNGTTGAWDVYVTSAGSFTTLWNNVNGKEDNDVFHFVNGCSGFTADELAMISGNDGGGKYYIDLYDLTTSSELETVISNAVNQMVASSKRCKGLLLPKNPTTVGTMLICNGSNNVNTGQYSCGQFIAYQNETTTMIHVYAHDAQNHKTDNVMEGYLTNCVNIMAHHTDISNNTATYSVSTNKATPLTNVSSVKGDKTGVTVVHTYNNELVNTTTTKPIVVITPGHNDGGDFASAVAATGMKGTPNIEELKFMGNVNTGDIQAINEFTSGPKVVDLSEVPVATITKTLLDNLSNDAIEYLILPAGMDETVVCNYTNLANLKCVISSNKSGDQQHNLTAYVRTAGNLAEARYWATGGEVANNNTQFKPQSQNLTSVKLMGELNIDDISVGDSKGLQSEHNSITTIDLEDAHFANVAHMNLSSLTGGAGFGSNVTEVKLPKTMTEIPANCLYQLSGLTSLHIPYSYTTIGETAFYETNISHITTEDANGGLIDNGENTYSLSANIQVLGTSTQGHPVFPNEESVTDVYCLATKTPICYKGTFPSAKVYNNGGMDGNVVYSREKYKQDGVWTAVLHFPSEETFNNETDASKKNISYDVMREFYTDPTRVFTKLDQTGAVDANGDYLLWPDHVTQEHCYKEQAENGYIWDDYTPKYEDPGDGHLVSMTLKDGATTRPFYPNYSGWHQFVLANATYYEPVQIVEGDKIIEEYQEAGWFTICLPYDLTVEQVIHWLGVPASHDNVICKQYDKNGNLKNGNVRDPVMPDARQLLSVERLKAGAKNKAGNTYNKNMVYLRFTNNLLSTNEYKYLEFNHSNEAGTVISYTNTLTEGTESSQICLKGGRPYIIKAYKRLGETIQSQNIGRRIMTHHADELDAVYSCIRGGDTSEQLMNQAGEELNTLKFAKPYEKHKVQAFNGNVEVSDYMTYKDGDKDKKYYYTMIGQFWNQDLPKYCFYMSHGTWYRNLSDQYTWQAYKCVIIPTVEVEGTKGEGYRDDSRSNYPQTIGTSKDLLDGEFYLGFADGRDDDDFKNYQQAKYVFVFDDEGITEYDENGEMVTAIDNLDGEDTTVAKGDGKVYNMSGQYVGSSINGLAKGMYIVNGKKIVVK